MLKKPVGEKVTLPNGKIAPLSPAFRAGDTVYVSGQLSFDDKGAIQGHSIQEQTTICLQNIESVLSIEGMTRQDIVKLTVFLTDERDYSAFNQAYAEFFKAHRPSRSAVKCELLISGAKIEIEAIAVG